MRRLEAFGFLGIQRRRKRAPTPLGMKVVQDCNSYVLGFARGLGALAFAAFGKKPAAAGEKSERPSEFTRPPAIKNDHFRAVPQCENGLPKSDYAPILE